MRRPFRRRHRPAVQRISLEGIDGHVPLRLQLDNLPEIRHVIRHEPIPKPESACVIINRQDGSPAWRGFIQCGPRYRTRLQIPMASIYGERFSPAEFIDLEFEWER